MLLRRLAVLLCSVIGFAFQADVHASQQKEEISAEQLQKVLLKLPWAISDREEKVPEREARALRMSKALIRGVKELDAPMNDRYLVAVAVSIWWHETRFSHEVHRGGLSRWGSDDGRAKCFGQLHAARVGIKIQEGESLAEFRARQKATWKSLAGTDFEATKRCAVATMRAFRSSLGLCRNEEQPWISAFGEYGSGDGKCRPLPQSKGRYRLAMRIAANI